MNLKISKEHHERLSKYITNKYLFGSRLFGTHHENSDYDYIAIYDYEKVFGITENKFGQYPNIHSLQFDDVENNTQYVWMSQKQFNKILHSGDGTMLSDVVLFNDVGMTDKEKLSLCRTYKIIKAYCGVAKRDIKLHPNSMKKRFHAVRSIYTATCLMDGVMPKKDTIQYIQKYIGVMASLNEISDLISEARMRSNKMLENGELSHYNIPTTGDDLLDVLLGTNNIGEFKY